MPGRASQRTSPLGRGSLSETTDEAWESDDCVRRTVVLPIALAERLAARAERLGLSVSDLLVGYAEEGLRRDEPQAPPSVP